MSLPRGVSNALEYLLRFLFGDDIFVSYSREDGITYAEGLASELANRNFSCRVDLWETVPGAELPWSLKRALRRSKMLVLIGTSRAAESPHVGFEITEFLTTSGIVIPIGFCNAIQDASWFPQIRGLPITNETEPTALITGKPSLAVLSRIENSVKFRRRNRRIRDLSAVAFAVFLLLIGLSLLAGRKAVSALREAEGQKGLADAAAKQRAISEQRAQEASEREQAARRSATEQEHRAEVARKVADLEEQGAGTLRQFQSGTGELEALEAAVHTGRALLPLIGSNAPFADYPTSSPVLALNTILTNIHEKNRFHVGGFGWHSLTLSHDDRRLAIVRSDDRFVNGKGSLWISDLAGRPLWHCAMADTGLNSLDFDREESGVIVGTQARGFEFWDPSCKPVPAQAGRSIPIDRGHGLFAEAGPNESIRITDSAGKSIATVNWALKAITGIRVHPSGELILASADLRTIQAWRGTSWATFFGPSGQSIQDFQFTGDGRYVVVELQRGPIQVLDISGAEVAHWNTPDSDLRLCMSPVGSQFATADGKVISIWNATGKLQTQFTVQSPISDMQFTEDGSHLLGVAFDTIRFLSLKGEPLFQLAGHTGAVRKVFLAPDGQHAVTAGVDGTVRFWDLTDRPSRKLVGAKQRIQDLAFVPGQDVILAISRDGSVTFWDQSGRQTGLWKANDRIDRARVSPDGKKIALIYDARVEIRDLGGQIIPTGVPDPETGSVTVLQAAFSPDGRALALSRAGGSIQIQNIATGRRISQPIGRWVYGLAFDAAGTKVAATAGTNVLFFDRGGNRAGQVETGQPLLDVSFSSDGRYMAVAGADGSVGLWTSAGQFLRKIYGHSARILTVCFSPDNRMIATASEDQAVRISDIKGRQLAVFPAPVSAATMEVSGGGFIGPPLKFSPDGQWLALGSDDGIVRIWPVDRLSALIDRGVRWLADYRSLAAKKLE